MRQHFQFDMQTRGVWYDAFIPIPFFVFCFMLELSLHCCFRSLYKDTIGATVKIGKK